MQAESKATGPVGWLFGHFDGRWQQKLEVVLAGMHQVHHAPASQSHSFMSAIPEQTSLQHKNADRSPRQKRTSFA
jgi:hypothetical protein